MPTLYSLGIRKTKVAKQGLPVLANLQRPWVAFGVMALLAIACSKGGSGSTSPTPTPTPTPQPIDPVNTAFPNEVAPPAQATCAQGAYYRKQSSSVDVWRGITGIVVLPSMQFDSSRTRPTNNQQFLDNPSVYMGGNASGQETDIGLTWEVIKDVSGNVSADRRAFRPFLRRTAYGATGQTATYINAPAIDRYYWYPGDTISMTVKTIANGVLQLTVESRTKKFDTTFSAEAFTMTGTASFKRVNAIDQVSNEGKPVQPSKTKVMGARWLKTSLFRLYNGDVVEAPMHAKRFTSFLCPDPKYFSIEASDDDLKKGGEGITIDAGK